MRTTPSPRPLDDVSTHRRPVPAVTVIVPALDEERSIERCLASVLAQDEPRMQVIVVDGGSSDATASIVKEVAAEDPRVELIPYGVASIPGSLNAALAVTDAPWLVRVDAHSTIPPGYVSAVLDHLETGRWGGVGGRKDAVAETTRGRAIAAAMSSRFGVGNSVYHYGTEPRVVDHIPFGAYATETIRRLGGWDERLVANEDFELDYRLRRAGLRLLFDPEVRIQWRCRESIGGLFRQYVRYGRGKADVAALHPASLQARHLAPPALVVLLVVAAGASVVSPAIGIAIASPYAIALTIAVATTARKVASAKSKAVLPTAFAAMHIGWGIGFLRGMAAVLTGRGPRGRQRARDRATSGASAWESAA